MPAFKISAGSISNLKNIAGDDTKQEYFSVDTCLASAGTIRTDPFKNKELLNQTENSARWIALSNKYFCSILLPKKPFSEGNTIKAFILKKDTPQAVPYLSSEGIVSLNLAPGENISSSYSIYTGPKERILLKNFDSSATKIMHLGWNWLEPISQLLLSFLVRLNNWLGNYGWSIIVLTVLVKLIFWPITEKANSSMKNMQKLQPLVQEIKEKYKNDPKQMNLKVMGLYKEHKVNPLGGCLPILLQIPVFFALYNTLNGAVELRQASFFWALDLSRPDSVCMIPLLQLPLNPLVLAMAATMFLQQKMTPVAADPMQQKMMMFMPLIMLVMLYSLPSGLTLYWTVSQIISIIQLGMNKYMPLLKKAKGTA
jgi:YidC/Oxa1 family membrane protein insertase